MLLCCVHCTVVTKSLCNRHYQVLSPQDMSSFWKSIGRGGPAGKTEYPCHVCLCQSCNIRSYKTYLDRCKNCTAVGVSRCYCCQPLDKAQLEWYEHQLHQYTDATCQQGLDHIKKIRKESKVLSDPNQVDKTSDPLHLDYDPPTIDDACRHKTFITGEVRIRLTDDAMKGFLIENPYLKDRVKELKKMVEFEEEILKIWDTLNLQDRIRERGEPLLVDNAMPCVLHAEMRINEKLFYTFLEHALHRYQPGGKTAEGKTSADLKRECQHRLEETMNGVIMGNELLAQQGQWSVPYNDGEVSHKSLSGDVSRKFVEGMKTLVTIAFAPDLDQPEEFVGTPTRGSNERLMKDWHKVIDLYLPMMELAKQHEDLSEAEILRFHKLSATFFAAYCDLPGGNNTVTNYLHMFGAGHMTYYLRRYKNLYKYSQQGWEALNQKIKHYYFNNTDMGGCIGGKHGEGQTGRHTLPLMKMFQRCVMWRTGLGEAFFYEGTTGPGFDLIEEEGQELEELIQQLREDGVNVPEEETMEFGEV